MKKKNFYNLRNNFSLEKGQENIKKNMVDLKQESFALAKYSSLGYYLVIPLLGGVFLGLFIDKTLHIKPFGIVCGILIGTIATFYNLIKLTKEN